MLNTRRTLVGLLIVLLFTSPAFADRKEDFQEAYQAYQRYVEAGDVAGATEMAAESYKLGAKLYGKNDTNTAKLAINYAALLNDAGTFKQARKVLKGKQETMENRYGANATLQPGSDRHDPPVPVCTPICRWRTGSDRWGGGHHQVLPCPEEEGNPNPTWVGWIRAAADEMADGAIEPTR